MSRVRTTIASLAIGVLVGCGSASGADHFVTGTIHPRYAGQPAIFMHDRPAPPTESLEEIGLVRAAGYGNVREDQVWLLLQSEAAQLGADVIVRVRRDQSNVDLVLVGVAARRR